MLSAALRCSRQAFPVRRATSASFPIPTISIIPIPAAAPPSFFALDPIGMKFRPCIDLHDGVVKQIVGSTLRDDTASGSGGTATATATAEHKHGGPVTNFVATKSAADYAR